MTPRPYRHTTRVIAPPSVGLSLAMFGLMEAFLIAGTGALAILTVAVYLVVAGRPPGRAPTWHAFAIASVMFAECLVWRVAMDQGFSIPLVLAVAAGVAAAVFTAWPRIGTSPSSSASSETPTGDR